MKKRYFYKFLYTLSALLFCLPLLANNIYLNRTVAPTNHTNYPYYGVLSDYARLNNFNDYPQSELSTLQYPINNLFLIYYIDSDLDGYGDSSDPGTDYGIDPGVGYSLTNNDCDDTLASINPAAIEIPCNGIDENCNGMADDTLSANLNSSDSDCFGASNGSITISAVSGGSGSYDYSIDGGATWTASLNNTGLTAGSYDVQIRDANATSCVIDLDGGTNTNIS
ncbi:MopE-related protein, partial [Aestuariivivens sediminis]|uniref:MopE-related protein n=1 Tax=Aestuariivivens sediminis TaxID=2913557 RepID=UPI001F571358